MTECCQEIGGWIERLVQALGDPKDCFEDPRVVKRTLDVLRQASSLFLEKCNIPLLGLVLTLTLDHQDGTGDTFNTLLSLIDRTTDRAVVASIMALLKLLLCSDERLQRDLLVQQAVGTRSM